MSSKGEIPKSSVKTNRRRRPRKHVDPDDENRPKNDALAPLEDWSNDNNMEDDKNFSVLSKKMRKAEQVVRMDVWRSNDALRNAVVRSSLRLAVGEQDGSDSLLLLHEHESSLVKSSRARVKEATETKEGKEQYPRLLLATHSIRALARFATKSATQEALLQLLYHIINTLGNDKFDNDDELMLLAFEALHHILLRYKTEASGARISFDTVAREEVFVFPIPIHKKGGGSKDDSSLSFDKVCTIAVQGIVLVSQSILKRPRAKGDALPDCLCRLHQQPLAIARHLLATVATFWIHFQVKLTKNLKEGLSHCKRIHRVLWEQATKLSDSSPTECLELRQDSLSVLLSGESSSLCRALECKFGDTVCTYAWKASSAFLAQIPAGATPGSKLHCFHQTIGSKLDRAYDGKAGLSYLEYCSLRAQHVGIEPPTLRSSLDPENRQNNAILRTALLSVELSQALSRDQEVSSRSMKCAKEVVRDFRAAFIDDSSLGFDWSLEDTSRISKILLVNSLHKSLYNFTKEASPSSSKMSVLRIGAKIMSKCFGPFFLIAARKHKNGRSELCGKATDCFLRGVAVFETDNRQNHEKDESTQASQEFFTLSSNFHLFTDDSSPHLERFAKVRY